MEVWDATTTPIELEPTVGDQEAGATDLGAFGEGSFGVWTITAGVSEDVEVEEVSVILSGRGTVEDLDTGAVVQLAPGTVLRLAAGVRTRWTIVEPIRKVYVLR
jgi:uncharacterized protein